MDDDAPERIRTGEPECSIGRVRAGKCANRLKAAGGPRWTEAVEVAFLRALAKTGNLRVAADAVGYSAGAVQGRRRAHPDFADEWERALAAARSRRAAGSIVRYTANGRARRVRCHVQWSEAVEEAFLDALAASANVRLAAEEAGVGHTSVYRQRRLRADFAEKWQAALEQGYARLELALVEAAVDSVAGVDFDADRPIARMSAETALKLLVHHRAAATGVGKRSGWSAPPKGIEHYRDSILRKIAAIRAARDEAA